MANLKRKIKVGVTDGNLGALQYNDDAGAQRQVQVGPVFEDYTSLAGVDAGAEVPAGVTLYVFNTSTSVQYIAVSDAVIGAAPSAIANGVPLMPEQVFAINVGPNTHIRTSGSGVVGVYLLKDSLNRYVG